MRRFAALMALAVLALAPAAAAAEFDYTVVTKKTVDDALGALETAARADGFKIPGVHTMPFPTAYLVVELCDPEEAKQVLGTNLIWGLLLPCGRLAIYEDVKAKTTKISLLLPSTNTRLVDSPVVAAMAGKLQPRLIRLVDAVK